MSHECSVCREGRGWVVIQVPGPDGLPRTSVRACRSCNPQAAEREHERWRREDPAMKKHRKARDRRNSR